MLNGMLTRSKAAAVIAEFLGTATLVMVAVVLTETTAVSYFIGTSVAATLAVAYLVFSGYSGGYFNPAVTFGMWTARRLRTVPAVAYIVAQLLGGFASWQLFQYLTDHKLATHSASFTGKVFFAEVIGTFVLSIGFAAAANKAFSALESALAYGTSLFVGIIVASVASAAYLNPAVALGLRSFDWLYILGPLVGGLVGINLYTYVFAPGSAGPKPRIVVKRQTARSSK